MAFSDQQLEQLRAPLERSRIAKRVKQKLELKYLEGFDVIDTANDIFGFDGWDYTVSRLEQIGRVWVALVKVTVWSAVGSNADPNVAGETTIREDVGVGIPAAARDHEPGPDAEETAIKGAVTDALKRALRTFGNAFGNSLYAKDQEEHAPIPPHAPAAPPTPIGEERAKKLAGLLRKTGMDQGYSDQQVGTWVVAQLKRLRKPDLTKLTQAEGKALLELAGNADMAPSPEKELFGEEAADAGR